MRLVAVLDLDDEHLDSFHAVGLHDTIDLALTFMLTELLRPMRVVSVEQVVTERITL